MRREKACPTCGGTGRTGKTVCATCRGEGSVAESERVQIKIPEGTEDGESLRVRGKGGPGVPAAPPGDLYVTVRVFRTRTSNVTATTSMRSCPITVKEAYAGADMEVPTIHGVVTAKIPPGAQSRQRFRLRGKGVRNKRTGATETHLHRAGHDPGTPSPAGLDAATLLESLYEGNVRAELPKRL